MPLSASPAGAGKNFMGTFGSRPQKNRDLSPGVDFTFSIF
jgi:hypothetical protein